MLNVNNQRAIGWLVVMATTLVAQTAWAGFCTGKQNGLWCDGDKLVNCQGNSVSSSQSCPSGCQSNPPGVADACKAGIGFCSGKQSGLWCNGNDLVNCQGGNIASSQNCSAGCQSNPPGVADACKTSGPCSGKADGAWCNGDDLMQCKGGNVASSKNCSNGCQQNPAGTADVCKSATVPTNFCTGKSDGAFCDGNTLRQCKGNQVSGSQDCANGCQQNASGTPDVCKSATVPTTFCSGKSDGAFCDGAALKTCQGGKVAGESACKAGCQVNPPGTADACKEEAPTPTGFCAGKADGPQCNGNSLVKCVGGWVEGSQGCALGCQKNACKTVTDPVGPGNFCAGKANGAWCNGNQLAMCNGGAVVAGMACALGCQQNAAGVADTCKSPADAGGCANQDDGQWCVGGALLQCSGGKQQSAMTCPNGCQAMGGTGKASCAWKTKGFCSSKADGAWCDANLLTTCLAGGVKGAFPCPKGCEAMPDGVPDQCKAEVPAGGNGGAKGPLSVTDQNGCAVFNGNVDLWSGKGLEVYNQKAYEDPLGTCTGLTIHAAGCTITSMSMMHQMLGLDRTAGGKTGHTPDIENAWRTEKNSKGVPQGYAYTADGTKGHCLVQWDKTAGGLVAAYHPNNSGSCITTSAGKAIAQSLNAGMPVVAGVHWSGSGGKNSHWVLIVGADGDGVVFNDPWGGKQQIRLNQGALGKYSIDTAYTFFFSPGSGNFSMAAVDDNGDSLPEEALPHTLQNLTDEGIDRFGQDAGGQSDAASGGLDGGFVLGGQAVSGSAPLQSPGCTAGSGPGDRLGAVLLTLLAALALVRRRRAAN